MFNSENAAYVPNIINQTSEEEEIFNRTRSKRPFKEVSNLRSRRPTANSQKEENRQLFTIPSNFEQSKFSQSLNPNTRNNVIIQFDSEQDEQSLKIEKHGISSKEKKNNKQCILDNKPIENISSRNKDLFLLNFSDDEEEENQQREEKQKSWKSMEKERTFPNSGSSNQHIEEIQPYSGEYHNLNTDKSNKNARQNLILDFESSEDEQQEKPVQTKKRTLLSSLISKAHQKYYLQPIERGSVMQCVIKREKSEEGIKYLVYDATTLHNFITIVKDQDGYLVISKDQNDQKQNPANSKPERVIAKIISNFFGTEFNSYLCDYRYKGNKTYPVDIDKNQQSITIEYETNFFGIRGPRKMTAFIPYIGSKIAGPKHLNEIYDNQQIKKRGCSVLKYKNKTPAWNKQISAYVLNFFGRATISSVKNFIMIGEDDGEEDHGKILFGKFGKELFNLDIQYPYNLIQGISLAVSSFDRKLACE